MTGRWQTKSSKVVYENPWMIVHEDEVVMPNGKDGLYGYIDSKSDSVYIVPIDEDGNTYLIKQERYTIKQDTWECVAGRTDNEPVEIAARRELLEETGLQADALTIIGEVYVANGISTFRSTFCIARNVKHVSDDIDAEDGILAVQRLPLYSIPEKIMAGEITCSQSIAAFFMAIDYLKKEMI